MADEKTKKSNPMKSAETLDTVGTIASLVGTALFGPEAGIDLGAPFTQAANRHRQSTKADTIINLFGENPETAGLVQAGQEAAANGGLLNMGGQSQVDPAQDPALPAKLAAGGLVDDAQKIIYARASQKPENPLDILNQFMNLQFKQKMNAGALTDQEKIDAARQTAQLTSGTTADRQIQVDLEKQHNEPLSTDSRKYLREQGVYESQLNQLLKDPKLLDKSFSDYAVNLVGATDPVSRFFYEKTKPELFKKAQEFEQVTQGYGKLISGAAISAEEMRRLKFAMPNIQDSPATTKARIQDLKAMGKYAKLSTIALEKNRDFSGTGITRDQMNDFIAMQQILQAGEITPEQHAAADLARLGLGIVFSSDKYKTATDFQAAYAKDPARFLQELYGQTQ